MSSRNSYKNLSNLELIRIIQENDEEAKEYFVLKNEGLVYSCIQRFLYKSNRDDLFQIGIVGLMKALNHFDLSKEVQFSTYAIPIILGEIKRSFRDDGSIRISRSIKENYIRMLAQKEKLMHEQNSEPTYEQIAAACGCSIEEVYIAFDAHQHISSIDEQIIESDGKSITLNDQLADEVRDEVLLLGLNHEISFLSKKEKLILYFRYTLGFRQSEVAARLNCTQVQISRAEKIILQKLKDKMI